MFTREQRQFYEDNGYIVVPKLISEPDLARYYERFVGLCDGSLETREFCLWKSAVRVVCSGCSLQCV